MSQLIKDIASRHMKRIKRDEEGLVIIPGRLGQSHIDLFSRIGLRFLAIWLELKCV